MKNKTMFYIFSKIFLFLTIVIINIKVESIFEKGFFLFLSLFGYVVFDVLFLEELKDAKGRVGE